MSSSKSSPREPYNLRFKRSPGKAGDQISGKSPEHQPVTDLSESSCREEDSESSVSSDEANTSRDLTRSPSKTADPAIHRKSGNNGDEHGPKYSQSPDETDGSKKGSSRKKTTVSHIFEPKKKRQEEVTGNNFLFVQLGVIISIAVLIAYFQGINSLQIFESAKDILIRRAKPNAISVTGGRPTTYRYGNLTLELEEIKEKYTDSTFDDDFWDLIVGASWSHVVDEGVIKQPVVLMLVGQPGSTKFDEVAVDVAKMFSKAFTLGDEGISQIDGAKLAVKEMGKAKLDMDIKLREDFDRGGKVALISQFDKLPPCSIMLFHSYCDSENAPYKDVVIVFTLRLEETISAGTHFRDIEESVQEHLNQVWSQCPEELSQDKITAMHSRLSNNIAFVV